MPSDERVDRVVAEADPAAEAENHLPGSTARLKSCSSTPSHSRPFSSSLVSSFLRGIAGFSGGEPRRLSLRESFSITLVTVRM